MRKDKEYLIKEIIEECNLGSKDKVNIQNILSLSTERDVPFVLDEKIRNYAQNKTYSHKRSTLIFKLGITTTFAALILVFVFSYYPFHENNTPTKSKIVLSEFNTLDFEVEITAINIELDMIKSDMNNTEYLSPPPNPVIKNIPSSIKEGNQPASGSILHIKSTIEKLT